MPHITAYYEMNRDYSGPRLFQFQADRLARPGIGRGKTQRKIPAHLIFYAPSLQDAVWFANTRFDGFGLDRSKYVLNVWCSDDDYEAVEKAGIPMTMPVSAADLRYEHRERSMRDVRGAIESLAPATFGRLKGRWLRKAAAREGAD